MSKQDSILVILYSALVVIFFQNSVSSFSDSNFIAGSICGMIGGAYVWVTINKIRKARASARSAQ